MYSSFFYKLEIPIEHILIPPASLLVKSAQQQPHDPLLPTNSTDKCSHSPSYFDCSRFFLQFILL